MQKLFVINSALSAENMNRMLEKINTYIGNNGNILSVTPTATKDNVGSWLVVAESNDQINITES